MKYLFSVKHCDVRYYHFYKSFKTRADAVKFSAKCFKFWAKGLVSYRVNFYYVR